MRVATRFLLAALALALLTGVASPGEDRPGSPYISPAQRAVAHYARIGIPLVCGAGKGRYVALTFDDGPGLFTGATIDRLLAAHAHATFFDIGEQLLWWPALARRELTVGAVGDHTWTHPHLATLRSHRLMELELSSTKEALSRLLAAPVHLFRPPYLSHNRSVDRAAHRLGLLEVLWSIDTRDSLGASSRQIVANIRAGLSPGAIILMHENEPETQRALPRVLRLLRRRGYRSLSIPELLAVDAPTRAQMRLGLRGCDWRGRLSS